MNEDFSHILDEHLSRISDIYKCLFYSVECEPEDVPEYSNAPLDKYLSEEEEDIPTSHELKRLDELKKTLAEQSKKFLDNILKGKGPPSKDDYASFELLSHEFILRLRRLEHDLAQEGNGFDLLTGLRSKSVLYQDLEREMSACMRRIDYQIAVGFGRIDQFETLEKMLKSGGKNEALQKMASVLRNNMRVYDDAYNMPGGYFVISLKLRILLVLFQHWTVL